MKPNNTMTKTGMTKKTVKKLETSDSLNPVIGKMEQEVLKKKQKFKVEEKNELNLLNTKNPPENFLDSKRLKN
jgi:hypothetical protein